jgi:SnoaL-like domain
MIRRRRLQTGEAAMSGGIKTSSFAEADYRSAGSALSALDYQLIKQLLARASVAINSGNKERWLSCFAENASYFIDDEKTGSSSEFQGSEKLLTFWESRASEYPIGTTRCVTNIPRIAGDGRTAISFAGEWQFEPLQAGGASPIRMSICKDRLQKIGGNWKFVERRRIQEHIDYGQWADNAMPAIQLGGASPPNADIWPRGIGAIETRSELDWELISQASAARNYSLDFGDSVGLASLFTERGYMMIIGLDHMYHGAKWHAKPLKPFFRGRKTIEEFNRMSHTGRRAPERHWYHAPLIEIDGNHASSIMQTEVILTGAGDMVRPMTGALYKDRLRKIDGRWLFEEFCIFAEPAPQEMAKIVQAAGGQYVHNVR